MNPRQARRFPNRRRLGALLAAALVAVASCDAAWAGELRPGRGGARGAMRGGPFGGRGAIRAERMGPPARAVEQLPQPAAPVAVERPPEAPVDRGGRPGRLTPDERRALRQQINDAGRDIYRAPHP